MKKSLLIHNLISSTSANGPGKRFAIWLQGCNFNCKGCFNKEAQKVDSGKVYEIDELSDLIINTEGIEGVTYTGGEPFLQSEGLVTLSKILKKHSLTILSYTGFTYDELIKSNDKYKLELLGMLDILIDGRYVEKLPPDQIWKGSANQQIHFLSDKYLDYKDKIASGITDVEFQINSDGGIFITGFPEGSLLTEIIE